MGRIDSRDAQVGTRSFQLTLGPGLTPELAAGCWPPRHLVQHRLLIANRGWVGVKAGKAYTLSAHLRVDQPGVKAVLQLSFSDDPKDGIQDVNTEVTLTEEWRRYSFTIVAPKDSVFVAVGPDVSDRPDSVVTFWADAVQLEEGEAATFFEQREAVELGFETAQYGNVFTAGERVEIEMSTSNATTAPVEVDVEIRLFDYLPRVGQAKELCGIRVPGTADRVSRSSHSLSLRA